MNQTNNSPETASDVPVCIEMAMQIIGQLSEMYEALEDGRTAEDFRNDIARPMLADGVDPNEIEDAFEADSADISNLDMIRLSCAYVTGAIASYEAGNHENAWIGIGHAQYWMGFAYGLGFSKGAYQRGRSLPGQRGAQAHHGKLDPIRDYAIKLASKGDYRNINRAASAIKDKVWKRYVEYKEEFSKDYPNYKVPYLSEDNIQARVMKWLSKAAAASKSSR
ncbi:hypothetical protein [Burkholderia gladioli]|uniref:hypothetical protein n=1 Tax=Burkholderia gladioli TaxID=28095 RepID=UPI00163FFB81|nr:hypothetical protein [Burkholderia gladioli]